MINTVPLVEGKIVFDGDVPAFSGATLRVRVEDVSRMDAPAGVPGEFVKVISYDGTPIPFKVSGQSPDQSHRYNVRVHISIDGSDDIKKGDFITTQSYPVLTHGAPGNITVHVKKV